MNNDIKSHLTKHVMIIGFPADHKTILLNALEGRLAVPGSRPEIVYRNAINSIKRKVRR
jgi:hypothetical protein